MFYCCHHCSFFLLVRCHFNYITGHGLFLFECLGYACGPCEEERERLWDCCSASEVDKEVICCEVCYSNSSACIAIKIGTADYSFLCNVITFWN